MHFIYLFVMCNKYVQQEKENCQAYLKAMQQKCIASNSTTVMSEKG